MYCLKPGLILNTIKRPVVITESLDTKWLLFKTFSSLIEHNRPVSTVWAHLLACCLDGIRNLVTGCSGMKFMKAAVRGREVLTRAI